ncbi:MAG: chemotaxis protein CheA [Candidatus Synoicihabitans palmerolidicus]|nr:chemotaxis protein CheA [Candidatus Synoicihabitans palmerolidicus]
MSDALRAMLSSIEATGNDDDGQDQGPLTDLLTALKDPTYDSPAASASAASASSDSVHLISPDAYSTPQELDALADPAWGLFEGEPANAVEAVQAAADHPVAPGSTDIPDWGMFKDDADPVPPQEPAREVPSGDGWGLFDSTTTPSPIHDSPSAVAPPPPAPPAKPASAPVTAHASVRVNVALLDRLMNMVGEFVLSCNQLLQLAQNRPLSATEVTAISQRLNQVTSELQEGVMKTRMQPIGNVWGKFPRIVRDIAVDLVKQVRLEMVGAATELDRTIIEAIKDPLTHIIRNSVDHGVESPEVRLASGKAAEAHVLMRAFHEGGQVNIEIIDDGTGIDGDRIRRKVMEKGLITEENAARLNDRERVNLIFLPGFSTAEKITNVSGRSMSMDVVKTNIEKIGGSVDIHSITGQGTTLKIKIPLTLAIVPALVVRSAGDRFAIPQVSLDELVRIEGETADAAQENAFGSPVFRLRDDLWPLVFMRNALGQPPTEKTEETVLNIIVLRCDQRQFGLVVDEVLDEVLDSEEIVVKPLGKQLKGLPIYAGATIMGDGQIALILDALGIAQYTGVLAQKQEHTSSSLSSQVEAANERDLQRLLLFSLPGHDRLAVSLEQAARLEEFPPRTCGTQRYPRSRAIPGQHLTTGPFGQSPAEHRPGSTRVCLRRFYPSHRLSGWRPLYWSRGRKDSRHYRGIFRPAAWLSRHGSPWIRHRSMSNHRLGRCARRPRHRRL